MRKKGSSKNWITETEDDSEDSDHLNRASGIIRLGFVALLLGVYHSILGFSEWTKNRHIIIQAGITGGISIGLISLIDQIGQLFFTTFWGQAIYASGLRLRLLPIPLSLVIYALVISVFLLGFSLDSSIRDLQSELDEIKEEIEIDDDNSDTDS